MSAKRYSKSQWEAIEEALSNGKSKAQVTRDFGVSRHSIWMHEKRKIAKIEEAKKKSFWSRILGK